MVTPLEVHQGQGMGLRREDHPVKTSWQGSSRLEGPAALASPDAAPLPFSGVTQARISKVSAQVGSFRHIRGNAPSQTSLPHPIYKRALIEC